jgi:hypothetical protein
MRIRLLVLFLILLIPWGSTLAQADEPELQLHLRRTFGYQGGGKIQGRFSVSVSGAEELQQVTYLIDGQVLASTTEEPFRASFSTGSYVTGQHVLQAEAITVSGDRLKSQSVTVTFITAEESWQVAGRIVFWILGGVLVLVFVGLFTTGLLSRGKVRFELGAYGPAGGAVCPRCSLPYSRHLLAPNLLLGKLERCPHCGRVAIVPRASSTDLDQAEARFREDQKKGQREFEREEDQYRQQLEDSRFEG